VNRVTNWLDSEPVITRVGPVVLLIVGYLLVKGGIDQDTSDLVLGIVGIILGSGVVVSARAAVTPMAKLLKPDPQPMGWDPDAPTGRHAD
jgi:hypothetical protein